MKVRSFFRIYNKMKYFRKIFKRYKRILAPGTYHLYPCMRAIALQDDEILEKTDKYFANMNSQYIYQKIAKIMNFVGGFKNKRSMCFEYQAMYVANNYENDREVKLFSLNNKKILTICSSKKTKDTQLNLYEKLYKIYHLPLVTPSKEYKNSYLIDMVDLMSIQNHDLAVIEICECTKKLIGFHFYKKINELLKFSYEDERLQKILELIKGRISEEVLNQTITICIQHGDLSSENLIYGKSNERVGYWWIDWEHIKERVFFYDLFFYMLHSAFYFDNSLILEDFFDGKYDLMLNELFLKFGQFYDSRFKNDYFAVFLILFLRERVCETGKYETLEKYYNYVIQKGFI